MAINVVCPQCGKSYQVPESRAGQKGKCSCGSELVVPQLTAAATPSPILPSGTGPPPALSDEPIGLGSGALPPQPVAAQCVSCGAAVGPGQRMCPQCAASRGTQPGGYHQRPAERPAGITVFAVFTWLWSGLLVVGGAIVVLGGAALGMGMQGMAGSGGPARAVPAGLFAGVALGIGAVFVVIAGVSSALGYCLWKGANWARIVWIVLLGLQFVLNLLGLVMTRGSGSMPMPAMAGMPGGMPAMFTATGLVLPLFWLAYDAVFLVVLNLRPARDYCTQ